MPESRIPDRTFQFSMGILDFYKKLILEKEFIISKQLLRNASSIGTNVQEASVAYSKKEFAHKMSIASREARETQYWLKILNEGSLVDINLSSYMYEIHSIIIIATAIVKTAQKSFNK
ncbi:MAG: four helix bundle protein [Bacteroidales bacterium]|jgi:four helix bundle protein|nr:four helix bundle protein [Bacteroidales bacterium]